MFSSTDRPPNRLVIWKDRPSPACVTACGSSPAMGWPSKAIRPESGSNMPEIRLNAVVFPAPFGPISACSVRSATAMSTPRTAWMPPKDLLMSSATSTGPAMLGATWRSSTRASVAPDTRAAAT